MVDTDFSALLTPRLRLGRLTRADIPFIAAYRSLPAVARYQSWESYTAADAERMVDEQAGRYPGTPGEWFQFAVALRDDGRVIGDCGLRCDGEDPRQLEIGVTFSPEYQGRGFATEAVAAIVTYAFDRLGGHRVIATTDALNERAAALFGRLGFRREGHFVENVWFKGRWGDEYLFAVLGREWRSRTSGA